MKLCQICAYDYDYEPKEEPADCELIIELHRPTGITDKLAFACCNYCGESIIEHHETEMKQLGLINVA